ncbi:valine--tRNA ligase [Candidatus Roizmanbacteria bacterium]|nr:valine--tRNA ligase [Candidatus Roizmanbacteria bacterium]
MDKKFIPSQVEEKIYQSWEKSGLMKASNRSKKKPFCIILPPPNANADLHLGHAMYVYEDIMIRYHKFIGDEVLWLPGADHAGFETQYVFEKHLAKQDKSRFDYDRETLYRKIWDFVNANRPRMENQLRRLGFFLDWTRNKFTLDQDIVGIVYKTFKALYEEGLIYRAERLVNYCTKDGTSFSDLEVKYIERKDPLYYLNYGPFVLATVRPETKFGDTAVAVHPKDKRYKKWIGKEILVDGLIGKFKMKVVADEAVDPNFGTGVVKVTPAHDFNDFEIAKRHGLPSKQVIGFDGKLNELTGLYQGLKINEARRQVVEALKKRGLLLKVDEDYSHRIGVCYRCGTTIEPLPLAQWWVKIRSLADNSIKLIDKDKIRFYPRRFKKIAIQWLKNFHDWNISRQVVWGIRIPAWLCKNCREWMITDGTEPKECPKCESKNLQQDRDTFDTWFSSAQWPFATLQTTHKGDFDFFYPTSVMETGYEILPWWVARMIMIGYLMTKDVPFRTVFLHGMVRDKQGQKMSKSKGNVIDPLDMVNKYGADALRASLVFGVKEGNDQSLAEEKILGMRNFANKVWNIGRFIWMNRNVILSEAKDPSRMREKFSNKLRDSSPAKRVQNDYKKILKQVHNEHSKEKKKYLKLMDAYKFSQALGLVYEFLWHRFADYYIEELKEELRNGNIEVLDNLQNVYFENLKMLHPFMPFVTEAVWKVFNKDDSSILNESL